MATEALKSVPITNSDATPQLWNTIGEGGVGFLRRIDGSVTTTTAVTAGSTYQLCRIPSNAKIKAVRLGLDASVTTLTGDIGLYYSTCAIDGTPASLQGTKVNSNTGGQLFGAAVALAAVVGPTQQQGSLTAAKMLQPAWQACGLTSDPRGYFDLVLTTTATNSGAGVLYGSVDYEE